MDINNILPFILKKGEGCSFYSFSNADGKRWLMPARHMRIAMNLYQPSGIKGKLMKVLFPYLHKVRVVNRAVHAEKGRYKLHPDLNALLCKLFDTTDIEFSVFCGTPCVHQKITMQISKGERILGYAKFSDNREIKGIFRKEKETLDYLWQKGIEVVPECLYCGSMENGIGLFIQNTTKSLYSSTDHQWGIRETAFMKELHEKTKQNLLFEQTDFYHDLCFLCEQVNSLKDYDRKTIQKGVRIVLNRYAKKEVEFSSYHADFTPWNIYVEKGRLFAFDLEYTKRTYPPGLDYFHFFTQTAIFEKHLDTNNIWILYQQSRKDAKELFIEQDMDFAYLCYLLSIVAHYVKREKGCFTDDVQRNMNRWFMLIVFVCRNLKKMAPLVKVLQKQTDIVY